MRVISIKKLREFWERHADCEQQLRAWYQEASKASWKNGNEIKNEYPRVSILKNNRICFDIKGNRYRLIVKINYDYQMVWIRYVGTHSDYEKIDANNI